MTSLLKQLVKPLYGMWSLTDFNHAELTNYAQQLMFIDTRKGIVTLCWVLFTILVSSTGLYYYLGYEDIYISSTSILAILSLHMAFSVKAITETRVLYLLAITLIVINGVAMVLLAHQSGGFTTALFASVILLFLVMPLVPWGLREALIIILLIYGIFTTSTLSVGGRFETETLWILQYVMLGASLTTLVVISRNIIIRRHDIEMRYELEQAHDHMEMLSLKDPLTGAWNRRYLEQKFIENTAHFCANKLPVYFATIDINDFKKLNDTFGHDYGDLVLKRLVQHYSRALSGHEKIIRMGGDEFVIILASENPRQALTSVADKIRKDPQLFSDNKQIPVTLSIGIMEINCQRTISLEQIYQIADQVLYEAKGKKNLYPDEATIEMKPVG